jgi:hypothetical protein
MKIRKLNNKGFSHIEIILFAISLVVVGGIGYYVYYKNTTAHAGNLKYVYIGTASAPDNTKFNFSACKQAIAVTSGVASGATSGVTSGVASGVVSGAITYNYFLKVKVSLTSGVTSGVASGATSGVTSGVAAANYAAYLSNFSQKKLSVGPYSIGDTSSWYWTNGVTTLTMPFSSKITNYTWGSIQSAYKGGPYGMTGFWFKPNGLPNC